jgi:hypothetical protein
MINQGTVIMAIGDNRSLQYLWENPKACFISPDLFLSIENDHAYSRLKDSIEKRCCWIGYEMQQAILQKKGETNGFDNPIPWLGS